jgi:hypothetical protein
MSKKRIFALIGALLAWFAVISQFVTTYMSVEAGPLVASIGLFNYFTILTNIIVAISFSLLAMDSNNSMLTTPQSQTAITVYILVVGIIYSALLRSTWDPQGFQRVVDELLHTVVPLAYSLFWFVFSPKGEVKYIQIPKWLVFPAVYLLYSLVRGAITDVFPYPFMDVNSLGWTNVMFVCLGLTLFLILISLLLVWIKRAQKGV